MQVINKDLQSAAGKISLVLEAMAEFQENIKTPYQICVLAKGI